MAKRKTGSSSGINMQDLARVGAQARLEAYVRNRTRCLPPSPICAAVRRPGHVRPGRARVPHRHSVPANGAAAACPRHSARLLASACAPTGRRGGPRRPAPRARGRPEQAGPGRRRAGSAPGGSKSQRRVGQAGAAAAPLVRRHYCRTTLQNLRDQLGRVDRLRDVSGKTRLPGVRPIFEGSTRSPR